MRLREPLEEMARRRVPNDLTVHQAARALRLRQAEVLHLVDESEKLDLFTGYRDGNGTFGITLSGDYRLEYLLE